VAYGVSIANGRGTTILGQNVVPFLLDSTVSNVNSSSHNSVIYYEPPIVGYKLPFFTMTGSVNQFIAEGRTDNYDAFSTTAPERFRFNYNSNVGTVPFGYIALGNDIPYPSGGYGLEIRNSLGQVTFNSNGLLVAATNVRRMMSGDTITIPVGARVVPLIWFYSQPFNGPAVYGQLIREANNVFRASRNASETGFCCSLFTF